jgi:hypothetical protein
MGTFHHATVLIVVTLPLRNKKSTIILLYLGIALPWGQPEISTKTHSLFYPSKQTLAASKSPWKWAGRVVMVDYLLCKSSWKSPKLDREWGEKRKSEDINQNQASQPWWYNHPAANWPRWSSSSESLWAHT